MLWLLFCRPTVMHCANSASWLLYDISCA
jgi:hypothetical protein